MSRKILVTGGCGFIGSNLIRYWMDLHPEDEIVNVDSHTYAARPAWVEKVVGRSTRYTAERVDITDHAAVARVFDKHHPTDVIHLAAESHVCRSIAGPKAFVLTNFVGTFHLIEQFKELHGGDKSKRFHYVSTDEVFGQLAINDPAFDESTVLAPRSPYAATKASGDLLVSAYHDTYGVNTIITNCSNNFGYNQHEEKLIPKTIMSLLQDKPMTVYGPGTQIRDWIWVMDHCRAIDVAFRKGAAGERYCIGGDMEMANTDIISAVFIEMLEMGLCKELKQITTDDRPTDDFRYAVDCSKVKALGWGPSSESYFKKNLRATIEWYQQYGQVPST